jgi:hypothetical protein
MRAVGRYRFACSRCGESDEFVDTLEGAVRRARNLYWFVTVRGTDENDLSFVLCPEHHAQREQFQATRGNT